MTQDVPGEASRPFPEPSVPELPANIDMTVRPHGDISMPVVNVQPSDAGSANTPGDTAASADGSSADRFMDSSTATPDQPTTGAGTDVPNAPTGVSAPRSEPSSDEPMPASVNPETATNTTPAESSARRPDEPITSTAHADTPANGIDQAVTADSANRLPAAAGELSTNLYIDPQGEAETQRENPGPSEPADAEPADAGPVGENGSAAEPSQDSAVVTPVVPGAQEPVAGSTAEQVDVSEQDNPAVTAAEAAESRLNGGGRAGGGVGVAPERLVSAVEAILFVADRPITAVEIAQVLDVPAPAITVALTALRDEADAQRRGFELREIAGGWRLYTRDEFAPYIEAYVLDGQQARLTQAALETLAVIAYRQPVTRSRVSAIRGVSVDGVIRTLLTRALIEECGSEPETGGLLYRTTSLFLEKLGLQSLEDLPSLAPLLPELDTVEDVAPSS